MTIASQGGAAFAYGYDDIGNRKTARVAGIAEAGQTTVYEANAVNQYSAVHNPDPAKRLVQGRTVAGAGLMMYAGNGDPAAAAEPVPVAPRNGGSSFTGTVSASVTEGAALKKIHIQATRQGVGVNGGPVTTMREAWLYFPPKDEVPTYDEDGNLTGDGRWNYWWDAENRLKAMEGKERVLPTGVDPAALPARQRLEFEYDSQSRRVRKVVKSFSSTSQTFEVTTDTRFLYDGWNVIAEFSATQNSSTPTLQLAASYAWGLDLSGTDTCAGGVGGLLFVNLYSTTVNNSSTTVQPSSTATLAPCFDGNGNVLAYLNCAGGTVLARYEYDPFGRVMQKDEAPTVAGKLHHQFSTKYTDDETGLSYYGFRYYSPELGRWPNRNPIEERGGINLYCMVDNNVPNDIDYLGLASSSCDCDSIRQQLDGLLQATKDWNTTSPPWRWLSNECDHQASKLIEAVASKFPCLKLVNVGGRNTAWDWGPAITKQHNIVAAIVREQQVEPTIACSCPSLMKEIKLIDPYKDMWGNPPRNKEVSVSDFTKEFPYDNGNPHPRDL